MTKISQNPNYQFIMMNKCFLSTPSVSSAFFKYYSPVRCVSAWIILFSFVTNGVFCQNDSLRSRVSMSIELEKHPYFTGYSTGLEYARKAKDWRNVWLIKAQQAERFGLKSGIIQSEWYPKINKSRYACLGLSVSDGQIFPKYHAAAHLMQNLHGGVEVEGGVRFISVKSNEAAWVFIGGATKYWRNYLFNAKVYVAQGQVLKGQTFTFATRYYMKDEVSYFWLQVGTSRSAQIETINPFMFNDLTLNSQWLQVGVNRQLTPKWVLRSSGHLERFNAANNPFQYRILGSLQIGYLF